MNTKRFLRTREGFNTKNRYTLIDYIQFYYTTNLKTHLICLKLQTILNDAISLIISLKSGNLKLTSALKLPLGCPKKDLFRKQIRGSYSLPRPYMISYS